VALATTQATASALRTRGMQADCAARGKVGSGCRAATGSAGPISSSHLRATVISIRPLRAATHLALAGACIDGFGRLNGSPETLPGAFSKAAETARQGHIVAYHRISIPKNARRRSPGAPLVY